MSWRWRAASRLGGSAVGQNRPEIYGAARKRSRRRGPAPTSELTNSPISPTFRRALPFGPYSKFEVRAMLTARHCCSLAAVAALTCGLSGAPTLEEAQAQYNVGSASRITAIYRVDLAMPR